MPAPTILHTKTTTATKFGGDALNFVNQYLNGVDVTPEIGTPIIRTPTKIPSDILKFTDPAEDNTVTIKIPALSENKTINLVPTNVEANDEVLYKDTVTEISGKVISAGTNTISGLTNSNLSGSAGITDPNLAQITDKSKLPTTTVYTTDSQILESKTVNLTNNTVTDTSRSQGDLIKDNGTKYARFPRGIDTQVLKSDATDVVWGAVAYSELTDIPTEFTPEAHNHDADYSPLGHLHAYADITDKPTEFTPEAHNHAASEITSGTLAVARGGLNKDTITEHALLKGGAANTYSEIAPSVTDGQVLKMVTGTPAWADESGGTLTDVNNVGTGTGLVFRDIVTGEINLKTIKAGTNVTVTNNADDVTIASSGEGGGGGSGIGAGGTVSLDGDVSTDKKIFNIPHGLAEIPDGYSVHPSSVDALGDYRVDIDTTNIIVTYQSAPPTGTGNVELVWLAGTESEDVLRNTQDNDLGEHYYSMQVISAPAAPLVADYGLFYIKQIDANNDGVFYNIKKNGAYVEGQIA